MNPTNIDFTKLDIPQNSPFKSLTKKHLQTFLISYYSKNTSVKDMIKKYHLEMRSNEVARNLPRIQVNTICPYDGRNLLKKLPAK
ncbi:hypothetical protein OQI89_03155, partial [Lentilactobacillus diolivorans]|uniref:hypothetical protein n=1 Tax=Lentilactobacillus diolivorans TaxID=179838 RepID=UPI0024699256